ncbi:hypothetical protein [Nitrosomonas sp.]|uniref:hypothetical protein n=1 Tax=Nitrosomonas sp. TaxID=42353 RepID=UPI00262603A3|nr:hypothetical protein [Nitrosomonas sp.]MCW5602771.1 hypothetical protein [Nitrosomonas sp.]
MRLLSERLCCNWIVYLLVIGLLMLDAKQGISSQNITTSSEHPLISALPDRSRLDTLIVFYSETLGGSREALSGASLMIFNDGYMLVFRPAYMRLAGIYETYLDAATLDQLWHNLTDEKILAFDPMLIQNKIQAIKQPQPTLFSTVDSISDAPTTQIEIYPNRYQASTLFEQGDWRAKKNIAWYTLRWVAERYPDIAEIHYLLFVQQQLAALMERADLKKIG